MNNKIKILLIILTGALLIGGCYALIKKFQKDRQSALSFSPVTNRTVVRHESQTKDGREVKTYTAEELEKARKEGKLPPGMKTLPPTTAAQANEAAVQRSLRTIEEINRINAINQRLMEQQRKR